MRIADPGDTSGRGLFLVESLASAWGVVPTVEGKLAWFELPGAGPCAEGKYQGRMPMA